MSNYDKQRGNFKLPSAAYAPFRQAVQAEAAKHVQAEFDLSQEFWKGLTRRQQTDTLAYREAIKHWEAAFTKMQEGRHFGYQLDEREVDRWVQHLRSNPARRTGWEESPDDRSERSTVGWKLEQRTYSYADHRRLDTPPSRILKSDMDWPTNRTTEFTFEEATLTFYPDSKSVMWDVPENNHAVEHARDSWLGKVFFQQLDNLKWTAGTGGVLYYKSEYDGDGDDFGSGRSYASSSYGYLGIAEAPQVHHDFTNARGERIGAEVKYGKHGVTAKPVKLVRNMSASVYGYYENGWRRPTDAEKKRAAAAKRSQPAAAQGRGNQTSRGYNAGAFSETQRAGNGNIEL